MLFPNYSRMLLGSSIAFLSLGAWIGHTPQAKAIEIKINYSLDSNGFFGSVGSAQRMRLEEAASSFTGFSDQLSPLAASDYKIPNPASPETNVVTVNTELGENEIVVFAGSDPNLSSLGEGGSIWSIPSVRGQNNAPNTDFEPLVGFISFDDNANWHFGTTTVGLAGKNDFLSTAIHELAHVMGFGIAPSWDALVQNNEFTGAKSAEIFGGNVPLDSGLGHWVDGTKSTAKGVSGEVETAMDPTITVGERKLLTDLDYAGLQDIGWEVNSSVYSSSVPFEFSPSLGIFFIAGMFGTKKVWSTCKNKQ